MRKPLRAIGYHGSMKIAVLLSGGVDSSVALCLLKEEGHDLTAFYLKVWLEDELAYLGECPWEEDLELARAVCDRFDVPLEVRSLQKEYWDRVVQYTIDELRAGRTPSPDIFCNQRIKFGAFSDEIDASFERVATGHYARLEPANGGVLLKKGVDPVKDQTYFLSHMFQEQLKRASFPIGALQKSDVRQRAAALHLPNQARRDSQGICFLGKIKYSEFVRHHLGEREGDIRELGSGKVLGTHRGYWFHTIGQRQGARSFARPLVRAEKRPRAEHHLCGARGHVGEIGEGPLPCREAPLDRRPAIEARAASTGPARTHSLRRGRRAHRGRSACASR